MAYKLLKNNNKIFSLRGILLTLYIAYVSFSQMYAFIEINSISIEIFLFFIIILLAFIASNVILYIFNQISFKYSINNMKFNKKSFLINFIIILIIGIIIYNIKFFTGKLLFEPDFEYAISQANINQYADFSSPVFILIFAKIPIMIFNTPIFISMYYVFIRSLIISYIITALSINKLINFILIIYYCFLPLSIHSEMTLLKDTPCAIFIAVSILLIYKYYFLKIDILFHEIMIALFLSLANFMRPNAIIFSASMIIILFFAFKNRLFAYLRILIVFIVFLLLGNFILPHVVSIKKTDPSWTMIEVMSIPASTVMAVAKYKLESLNENEKEYLKVICGDNYEALDDFDEKVGWESVKFNKSIYNRTNLPFTYLDLASYTFDLLLKEPDIVIRQIIRSTSSLYGYRYVGEKRNNPLSKIYYLFANIEVGSLFFILLASLIIKCSIFDGSRVNILISIPIILFSIITALVIASPAITRYFLPLQMSIPIYVSYIFQKR